MKPALDCYLFDHLLESLRRDLRHEAQAQARQAEGSADWFRHGLNVRRNLHLLQYLNPKRGRLQQEADLQAKRQAVAVPAHDDEPSQS
jgi:hypothetical protein